MKKNFKFIHTADLHLGSILHIGKKINNSLNELLKSAANNAFKKLCDTAIEENVDFILISGDIYDREARSVKGNSFFIEQAKRLEDKGIGLYAIGGNHDPIKNNSELFTLPSNVHIFSSEKAEIKEVTDIDGNVYSRIVGQSYRENWDSRKMFENYKIEQKESFNIALLHTQLDGSNNYVPCTAAQLKEVDNIGYWALGHIHKCSIVNEKEPFIAYPGIPQGRDFGEEGIGGAFIVEVANNSLKDIKFIPLSEVIWKKINLDIEESEIDIKNISDLEKLILSKAEQILMQIELPSGIESYTHNINEGIKGFVVQWDINGRGEIYSMLRDKVDETSEYLIESLNERLLAGNKFVLTKAVNINIGKKIKDLDNLKDQNAVFKEISAFSKEVPNKEVLREELIKRLGSIWEVNEEYEDFNVKKLQLNDELLKEIINQAEQLAVDMILERSEDI